MTDLAQQIYENRWTILVVLVVLLSGIISLLFVDGGETGPTQYDAYVNESAFIAQSQQQDTNINVTRLVQDNNGDALAASGSGYTFKADNYMTEFGYIGLYNGNQFSSKYIEQTESGEITLMEISSTFHPDDEIINGYIAASIVERNGEDQLKANIYIDEDFRQHVSNQPLNIAWGLEWENLRPFQTVEVAPNVYMDTIYLEDTERFIHGSQISDANIAVGTFTEDDIQDSSQDLRAAIFLK